MAPATSIVARRARRRPGRVAVRSAALAAALSLATTSAGATADELQPGGKEPHVVEQPAQSPDRESLHQHDGSIAGRVGAVIAHPLMVIAAILIAAGRATPQEATEKGAPSPTLTGCWKAPELCP